MTGLRTTPGFPRDCHWCGCRLRDPADDPKRRSKHSATKDHVYPKSMGGKRTVWSCLRCNHLKGALLPIEWSRFRIAYPDYRRQFHSHGDVLKAIQAMRWSHRRPIRPAPRFPAGLVSMPPMCRGLV